MKTKRLVAGLMCAVMLLGFGGCKSQGGNGKSGERSLTHKITDEPLELTYFAKEIEDYSDQSIWQGAYDMTNILLKPILSENVTDMDSALALSVAAKDIPDVIYDWKQENFNRYGTQGALIPLNDLIDKYAPNYKQFLEENPDVKYYSTAADGNIYFIPFVSDGDASTAWFIRQDWLDKVGKTIPNTVDELYDVMVAFRDGDPNGNGEKDEVPFFGIKSDVGAFLSLFDAYESFRYQDGKVSFGPMEDKFLTGIKTIAQWYKEGLIDKELFSRSDGRDHFCANNTGGITHEWIGSTAQTNETYKDSIPGYNLVAMAPPAGPDGVRREQNRRTRLYGEGWAISSMNEHPEETMKYFDFWFTKEGRRLANFGIEGVHYDLVNDEPVFKSELLTGDPNITTVMMSIRSMTNFGFWQDYGYEAQWTNQIGRDAISMYKNEGYLPSLVERPQLSYFENEKRHSVLKTQIETCVNEKVQAWVFGANDPDAEFESFKQTLKSLDVDEYIDIEQKAYDSYLSSVAQ